MSSVKQWVREKMSNRIGTVIFLAGTILLNILAVNAFAFQCTDVTEIPISECEALQDLYNSTNGPSWQDNTGWLATDTPCSWFGVVCDNGELTEIHLAGNGLLGQLPETIGYLSDLEYLNMSDNELTGTVPDSIGFLVNLNGLWVGGNNITGLSNFIGNCSELTHLDLRHNQISSLPSRIGELTKLSYLTIHENPLTDTSIPAEFANLSLLTSLSFQNSQLTRLPAPVGKMTNLKFLDLSWNKPMESLEGIGNLTNLETLHLNSTELTELPEEMGSLASLKELWLSNNFLTEFPSMLTQLTGLETLLFTYNPQMNDELPLSLVNLNQMKDFKFDGTELCVPQDAEFQTWLAGIATVVSSGKECPASSNPTELEKAVKIMRMLTGHEGTCTDLDVDGSGKVGSGDAVLALQQATNVSDTTCGENWNIIGDIPEFSFLSEPMDDGNTAFTMNVDPFDQLMLTAVTTNGWTVEYFAVKDAMGIPVFLTKVYAQHDTTGEYLDVMFDNKNRPVSIEQQGNKKIVLNWENCTVYGEKEWTVTDELPDFSSLPSPVVDDQTGVQVNSDPSDPLWLTVTTSDRWTVKYFSTKDAGGSPVNMTFIHATNAATGDVVMIKIDRYGQPNQVSKQDGKIMKIDWLTYSFFVEDGFLQPPAISSMMMKEESSSSTACNVMSIAIPMACPLTGFISIPVLGDLLSLYCNITDIVTSEAICNESPTNSPKVVCAIGVELVSTAISIGSALGGPVTAIGGHIVAQTLSIVGGMACDRAFPGNSSGDPHIYPFDGLKYDFQAVGEFVLLQSTQDPNEMTIQMRQGPWPGSKRIAANTAVAMSACGDLVEVNIKNTPRLSINNTPVTMADKEIRQLKNGCKIYAETQWRYWIIWKDNSMTEVRTHNNNLDISVSLTKNRTGLVRGLLGNGDGDNTNDLQTRVGGQLTTTGGKASKRLLYHDFGNSWRITQAESLFTYAAGKDTSTYTELNFPEELVTAPDLSEEVRANAEQICRDAGITDPILLEDCILDVGLTGDPSFADNMTDLTPPEQSITVTDDWLLYKDAQQIEGDKIIHITPDDRWQTGMALREGALNLDGDFEKTFNIYMGNSNSGADGMVFLLLPEISPEDTSLNGGEGLGFKSACNDKPCFGVEIDTYKNSFDPLEDHVALIQNGWVDHNRTDNQGLPLVPLKDDAGASLNIEDDAEHSLTIGWKKEAQILSVTLDGNTIIAHEGLDLKTLLGTSVATYGFVGATGTATSEHYFYPVISIE
ncbi:MAG: hypothetical protein D3917_04650 [Candidatus Electrothrix sp. AX5]|nr:hypothetical protein [Candidatus Electrothrix sp. AX5]